LSLLDIGTFLLGDIATFFLGDVLAFLLGHVTTLLGWNIPALLGVMNLLTDLLVDGVALLGVNSVAFLAIDGVALPLVDSVALALGHVLAFLLGNGIALSLIDHRALLLRDVLTDLVLDSVALPLVDDLALSHGVGGALLLSHGLALGLEPGGAGLGGLSGARFLVEGFLDGSWHIDTLQFLGVEALFLLHSGTLLTDVIDRGTLVLDLDRAFSPLNLFLDRSLGYLTSSLLSVGTSLSLDISALLPGHRLICGLGNLVTDLLGNLTTYRLWCRSWSRLLLLLQTGIKLIGYIRQSKDEGGQNKEPHDDDGRPSA